VWPDFATDPSAQQYWTDEFKRYFEQLEFDGWWLDISDAPSWCTGSCGADKLALNPAHIPIKAFLGAFGICPDRLATCVQPISARAAQWLAG
jgi:alpha-glucosidase (family GH31 glycosyl hydrolase)